jgi:alkylhydroperoxidase/carboxymuconolactone decarboxylase family protein YurZ/quercetin dioxygenase-like cupin family protein
LPYVSGTGVPTDDDRPGIWERFEDFALDEVIAQSLLDDRTRMLAILAALMGAQGIDAFRAMLPAALNLGVTPVEAKEAVYQAVAYLGIGRTLPFLQATNDALTARGVALPLPGQATTTAETRLAAGEQAQADIFGERMRGFAASGPEETRHINRWLAANCFGDYYTRGGLDARRREMITFCFLAAQGGCEPQLTSHAAANLRIGNDKAFLIDVVSQCLPYIGYPRSINALRCVQAAAGQAESAGPESRNPGPFPMGGPLPEQFARFFIGQAYLQMLTDKGGPLATVTFAPGCRNNWHIHHKGGQILLVTGGTGWYQAWGEPARRLRPGDVVNIPPEMKHWHGAARNEWFSHLAVEVPAEGAANEWLEPVTDEQYDQLS